MELLGPMPRRVWGAGKLSREFFTRHGTLRHIRKLRHWPLDRVLAEKYEVPAAEVRTLLRSRVQGRLSDCLMVMVYVVLAYA